MEDLGLVYVDDNPKVKQVTHFDCECLSAEHGMRVITFNGEPEVYITHFLDTGGFFKRLWIGLKYIFGYKSQYGHFGEMVLTRETAEKLAKALTK